MNERGLTERLYVRHELWIIYAVAAVSYTLIGLHAPVILNWVVGPLWPVAFVWGVPIVVRKVTGWKAPLP